MSFYVNPVFKTDSYKLSHKGFMTEGTEAIYSNLTARNGKYLPVNHEDWDGKAVVYGTQATVIKLIEMWDEHFFNRDKESVIEEIRGLFDAYLGKGAVPTEHFEELHDLGYLPIIVKALPEGSRVNIKVPMLTIRNTSPKFAWLTNYLETWLSASIWKMSTVATIIAEYRKLTNTYAMETTGSIAGTEFQVHDFSYRGMSGGDEDPAMTGSAFLLSSCGTDNIPALPFIQYYYGTSPSDALVGTSVPASEHSLASTGIAVEGELETYRRWITKDYPSGIVSIIADTLDFFRVVTEFAKELKDDILNRTPNELGLAKTVFRPDSGDPVKILTGYFVLDVDNGPYAEITGGMHKINIKEWACNAFGNKFDALLMNGKYWSFDDLDKELSEAEVKGAVQCLWDIFGGTTTEQGFNVLHERVGLIYGDSITLERAKQIFDRLKRKGFASVNVVLGVGSYTSQYLTRDSLGMAVKATAAVVNGELYALSKDPVTDDGTKKSAKGLLRVEKEGDDYVLYDQQTWEQEAEGELKPILIDGLLLNQQTFVDIRNRLWS